MDALDAALNLLNALEYILIGGAAALIRTISVATAAGRMFLSRGRCVLLSRQGKKWVVDIVRHIAVIVHLAVRYAIPRGISHWGVRI